MMAALIAGERDPKVLAQLARSRMRAKIPRLEEAFAVLRLATFDDHHRFLLARMLARVDAVDAEIGLDMIRFPTRALFASWAKFAPGINSSAGKTKVNGSDRAREPLPCPGAGEAVVCAGETDTFLGARYRRLVRRRGKKKAIVAVGRSLLMTIWHLLTDPDTRFHDLDAGHYDRHVNTQTKRRDHVRQLEALGYRVTLEPTA